MLWRCLKYRKAVQGIKGGLHHGPFSPAYIDPFGPKNLAPAFAQTLPETRFEAGAVSLLVKMQSHGITPVQQAFDKLSTGFWRIVREYSESKTIRW